MKHIYAPKFVRQLKKLPLELQQEIFEKINLFQDAKNHNKLKVNKLRGRLAHSYSFSINYRVRVIFRYASKRKDVAHFLFVGDHDIYKE